MATATRVSTTFKIEHSPCVKVFKGGYIAREDITVLVQDGLHIPEVV